MIILMVIKKCILGAISMLVPPNVQKEGLKVRTNCEVIAYTNFTVSNIMLHTSLGPRCNINCFMDQCWTVLHLTHKTETITEKYKVCINACI